MQLPSMVMIRAFNNLMLQICQTALEKQPGQEEVSNWLEHKDHNPWVLRSVYFPLTKISTTNWYSTSFDTNLTESAHVFSQRYGTQLSLVRVIMASEKIDRQFFKV